MLMLSCSCRFYVHCMCLARSGPIARPPHHRPPIRRAFKWHSSGPAKSESTREIPGHHATAAMPGRAAALPASAPNWRQAESNLERAPQVGVNLESTSASWSQPGVALKTWSQHLEPGAKSERVERAKKILVTWALMYETLEASGLPPRDLSNSAVNGPTCPITVLCGRSATPLLVSPGSVADAVSTSARVVQGPHHQIFSSASGFL